MNPTPPKAEAPPPDTTEQPPAPPKPRPKNKNQKGKPKKVRVEMVKITAIDPNTPEMQPPPMIGPPPGPFPGWLQQGKGFVNYT